MASASSYSTVVQDLYVAYFGRPADYYGLQNFETALAAADAPTTLSGLEAAYSTNAAVKTLVDSFGTSAESTALYGSGSTESFVNAIFENLLNRPAAVSGLTFWVDAINSGEVTKGDAALAIAAGAMANTTAQGLLDQDTINNKVAVAGNFTTALGASSTQIVDYSGATAAQDARLLLAGVTSTTDPTTYDVQTTINNIVAGNTQNTFNLTTGVDAFTGGPGNNTFNAVLDNAAGVAAGGQAATLQSFDTITGGTLNNTLNITDFGLGSYTVIPSGAAITGITTLNIASLEGVAGNTSDSAPLDLSGWTGLTALNVTASNGEDNIYAPTANLNIVDSSYIYVAGGATISVTVPNTVYSEVQGTATTSTVTLNGGDDDYVYDLHNSYEHSVLSGFGLTWSAGTNTIATVNVNAATYADIYSDALTTLNVTDTDAAEIYSWAAAGTRTLAVNLNDAVDTRVEDDTATTVNFTTATKASTDLQLYFGDATAITFSDAVDLSLDNGAVAGSGQLEAGDAKTVTITGAGAFTADFSAVNAAAVINASGSSGVITVEMGSANGVGAAQSFTGGTGQDIITVGATQTGAISAGSATNNEIILANAAAATQADLASYTHFSILGVSGTTSGVFDMSKLTNGSGYTSFDVQGSGGNVTFTNAATGSSLSLEGGNSHIITLQTADTTGATDTVNVSLGSATSGSETYAQVTVEDSNFVGTATVNLTSNTSTSGDTNTLTSLFDNNLITLNIAGAGTVDIGTISTHSTSVTINNAAVNDGFSYAAVIGTLTDNYLATLTFGGSAATEVETLSTTSTSLTIVDNDAAAFTIATLADTALTTATFTNSVNTTTATFGIGAALTETGLATLNLNGNVALTVGGDTVATGITVAGGTDNATVSFTGTEVTASGATDSITLGNGAGDSVTLGAGLAGSTQTVVLGSGAGDTITSASAGTVNATVGSSTSGTDTITANEATTFHATAGNGTNVISDSAAGAAITITVGTGVNTITVGADTTGTISLGAHTGTDTLSIGASGTSLTAIEKISGLNNATTDTLAFSGDANALTGFTQVTAGAVVGSGGDTTLLADWVAAADGLDAKVAGAAHSVTWFQYQGNTYLLESVAGATADAGTMVAGNTLVELTGTSYTFAHTTGAGGVVHLLG